MKKQIQNKTRNLKYPALIFGNIIFISSRIDVSIYLSIYLLSQ